ncbi:hypothetical protein [Mesorhizobium sp. M0488]|uniref:hypothetical protein n=1 Tax=Mesorhizobium sp. M0488 TaxID=2956949 RepID=UPI00333DE48F
MNGFSPGVASKQRDGAARRFLEMMRAFRPGLTGMSHPAIPDGDVGFQGSAFTSAACRHEKTDASLLLTSVI